MESAIEALKDGLRVEWEALLRHAPRVVVALLLCGLLIWIGRVTGRFVVKVLQKGNLTSTHRNFFRHLITWLFALVGLVIGLNVLGLQAAAAGLMAGGGITAVALGFAFRQIGENFLAGFFLAFSRPFEVGDLIQSGEFQGSVRGIELRSTHIRTGDGRDVYIPSSQIFNQPVVNFTRDGLRRLSFVVGIDYSDETDRARSLLLEAVREAGHVLPDPGPAVTVSAMLPQYQELEVSFWVDMFKAGVSIPAVRSDVMSRCRGAIKSGGFTISSEVTTSVLLDVKPGAAAIPGAGSDDDRSSRESAP